MEEKKHSNSLNKASELNETSLSAFTSGDSSVTAITIQSPELNLDSLTAILSKLPYIEYLAYITNYPLSEAEIQTLKQSLPDEITFRQVVGRESLLPKSIYFPERGRRLITKGKNSNKISSTPISDAKKLKNTNYIEGVLESESAFVTSTLFSVTSKNSNRRTFSLEEIIGIGQGLHTGDQRKKLENLLGYATGLAKIGSWEIDFEKNTTYLSAVGFEILETEGQVSIGIPQVVKSFKPGKDRQIIRDAVEKAKKSGKSFDAELRIQTDKGKDKWVRIIGDTEGNGTTYTRLFGSIQDIDRLKRTQIKLAKKTLLMEALTEIEGILLETDSIWAAMERCFHKIGELLSVDRVYFFEYGTNPYNNEEVISQRTEWVADGTYPHIDDPEMTNVPIALLGNLIPLLKNRKTQLLEINSISNSFLLDVFNDQNIKQAILAPIIINQNFFGFIGCDQCSEIRKWSKEEYTFLEISAARISVGIENHESNQKIAYKSTLIQANSKAVELLFQYENWEKVVDEVLKLMGETIKADRVYYFQCLANPETNELYAKLLYEWTNGIVSADITNPDYQHLRLADHPKFLEKVKIREPFTYLAKDLDGPTRAILDQSQIKSILQIPLFKFGEFSGYIGFDGCVEERVWSVDEISFLKSITSNLGIAMERKEHVSLIHQSNKEKNDILESIGDAFFTINYEGKVTFWNKKANELLHLQQEGERLEKNWYFFDIITDPVFLSKFHETNRTKDATSFETHYANAGAWFEVNLYPSNCGVTAYLKDISEKKIAEELINQSNERYEKLTEATNDAIYDWDMTTNSVFMGKGFKTLFGYDYLHEPYSFDIWQDRIHPDDQIKINNLMEQVISDITGSGSFQTEYRYRMKNGEYAYVVDRGRIIRNESGTPIRLIGATQDISYRKTYEESLKKLNLSLQDRAKQLSISNTELEQFAFVVSHDLQEPLRMVTSFLTQLNRKYRDKLDEKAQTYIHFAVDGAKRMREIILDLLEFSTVGKQVETLEEINLSEILQEVQYLLGEKIEASETIFKTNQLPVIRGYKNQLIQVLIALIDNGLKYRNIQIPLTITVTVRQEKGHWLIAVADNGIGIEEDYFENIFVIFKKLHPKDAYGGTGMGLALVKKIIENWGGKIWLDSTLHVGSTFYFTIPINNHSPA
ncbi:MAG TPA: ATP-binding protein [Lunatimonas sp.]|nr:ATP-binding protein [Lunatimonas sp.]